MSSNFTYENFRYRREVRELFGRGCHCPWNQSRAYILLSWSQPKCYPLLLLLFQSLWECEPQTKLAVGGLVTGLLRKKGACIPLSPTSAPASLGCVDPSALFSHWILALGLRSAHIPTIPARLLTHCDVVSANTARFRLEANYFTDDQAKVWKNKTDGSQTLVQELMPVLRVMFSLVLRKTGKIRIMQWIFHKGEII